MSDVFDDDLTCPYDGEMTTYVFGTHRGGRYNPHYIDPSWATKQLTLRRAVRAFRVAAMFPHQYADKRIAEKRPGPNGRDVEVYLRSEPGAVIPVSVLRERKDPEENPRFPHMVSYRDEVARIAPDGEDDAGVGVALLQAQAEAIGADSASTALQAGSGLALQGVPRTEVESKQLEINAALGELEQKKHELEAAMRELRKQTAAMELELKRRLEQVWMIEVFLGSKEQVVQLREGENAPVDTPITVRQRVLCMDEEMAVHDWLTRPEKIGDFTGEDLHRFDDWLVNVPGALDAIFPHPKGIVGLRVRRNPKVNPLMHPLEQAAMVKRDTMTYLLIRNGENLYRLWTDVRIWPRMFAAERDYVYPGPPRRRQPNPSAESKAKAAAKEWPYDDKTYAEDCARHRENWEKDSRANLKAFFVGLLAVQGLIERSTFLHPLPTPPTGRGVLGSPGINVFHTDHQVYFNLVRDDEAQRALVDASDPLAHLTWPRYRDWLHEQTMPGVRVIWNGFYQDSYASDRLYNRTGIRTVSHAPEVGGIYVLERGPSFLYQPGDKVWSSNSWDYSSHERKRRVRFRTYTSEILPIDFCSWRILEHLIRDRGQRHHYGAFFARAFTLYGALKREAERERPFVDLVLVQCDVEPTEVNRARAERLVRWWKVKTKANRSLGDDEPKALRMIVKAFKRGDDFEGDPEIAFMEALHG